MTLSEFLVVLVIAFSAVTVYFAFSKHKPSTRVIVGMLAWALIIWAIFELGSTRRV